MNNRRVVILAVLALLAAGMRLWASKPAPRSNGYTKKCIVKSGIIVPENPPKNYSYSFYNAPMRSREFAGAATCYVTLAPATKVQVIDALKKYNSDIPITDEALNSEENTVVHMVIEDLRYIKKLTVGKAIWLLEHGPKKNIRRSMQVKPAPRIS